MNRIAHDETHLSILVAPVYCKNRQRAVTLSSLHVVLKKKPVIHWECIIRFGYLLCIIRDDYLLSPGDCTSRFFRYLSVITVRFWTLVVLIVMLIF